MSRINSPKRQSKYSKLWSKNAAVLNHLQFLDTIHECGYDDTLEDFPKEYLPYFSQSQWDTLPRKKQLKILSFGWIVYNLKTIIIEQSILTEYCRIVLSRESNFSFSSHFIERLSQVQMDETYHTYFSYLGINLCENVTDLQLDELPPLELVHYLSDLRELDPKHRELKLLALTTVCETTISKYLSAFPHQEGLQPAFRYIADTHRKDEGSHSSVFIDLVSESFHQLTQSDADYLRTQLIAGVKAIQSVDQQTWTYIFNKLGIAELFEFNPHYNTLFNFYALKKVLPQN